MATGYLFKAFASKASPDYIPSLIGTPQTGAADTAYFEQTDLPDHGIDALSITKWAVEGTQDRIVQVRSDSRVLYYIPESELIEQSASDPVIKQAIRSAFIRKAS